MSDRDLLVFGCMVSFIAVGGAYVLLRARFQAHTEVARERFRTRRTRRIPTG
jgi:hypothetical protein